MDILCLLSEFLFTCTNELLVGWDDCWLRGREAARFMKLLLLFLLLKGIWLPEGVIGGSWFKNEWFGLFRG